MVIGCALTMLLSGPFLLSDDSLSSCREFWDELLRDEAFASRQLKLRQCLDGKFEVMNELAAGTITPAQAVDRFRQLHGLLEDGQDFVLGAYNRVEDHDEALYQNLLNWVDHNLINHPRHQDILAQIAEARKVYHKANQKEARKIGA
jgi:hypothetical protein